MPRYLLIRPAAIAFAVALSGCASPPSGSNTLPADLSATPSAASVLSSPAGECPVWVYRTQSSFHKLSPSLPFIFVNGAEISKIGIGQTFCLNLAPGKYQVSSREPLLYMPGPVSGTVTLDVKAGEPAQYIRYSKELGAVIPMGSTVGLQSDSQFRMATKAEWAGLR